MTQAIESFDNATRAEFSKAQFPKTFVGSPPVAFTSAWDYVHCPGFAPQYTLSEDGQIVASPGFDYKTIPTYLSIANSGVAPYAVYPDGLDANPGTEASPFKTLNAAIAAGNASPNPVIIVDWYAYRKADGVYAYYSRNNGGTISAIPTKPLLVRYHGRIHAGLSDSYTWTQTDATNFPYQWQATVPDVSRVSNRTRLDRHGNFADYNVVGSLAACRAGLGNMYFASGTLYVTTHDGAQPTDINCRVYRRAFAINWGAVAAPVDVFFHGASDGDALEIEGAINIVCSGVPASKRYLVLDNLVAKYAGGQGDGRNAISVDGWHGTVLIGADCASASLDLVNIHNVLQASGAKVQGMTIGCRGRDAGRFGGNSQNILTTHENVVWADICGDFEDGSGGTVTCINETITYCLRTRAAKDRGDAWTLSSTDTNDAEFKVGRPGLNDTAVMYLEGCIPEPFPGQPALFAASPTSSILTKGMVVPGRAKRGPGTFGTF